MTDQSSPPFPEFLLRAAEVVGISRSTIWRKISAGAFPAPRKQADKGSAALWHVRDVERWAEKREVG